MNPLAELLMQAVGHEHVEALADFERPSFRVAPGSPPEVAEVIRRAGSLGAAIHPVGTGGRPAK